MAAGCAISSRRCSAFEETWDLKDDAGRPVAPGRYVWKAIVGPQLELAYGLTPYPNIQNYWSERMPWLVGHDGMHGWLSDHSANWACATSGDRLYFAASMAEAGVTLIECDLDGKKVWGRHDFGAWKGVYQMAADTESLFVDNGDELFCLEQATRREVGRFSLNRGPLRRGWRSAMAARDGKVYFAYTGEPVFDNAATAGAVDLAACFPVPPRGDRSLLRLLRIEGSPPGDRVDPRSDAPQGNGRFHLESEVPGAAVAPTKAAPDLSLDPDLEDDELGLSLEDPARAARASVIAFSQAVPLGSVVFPWPIGTGELELAVLKPGAPYPPQPSRDGDWIPFESSGTRGWNCVSAPPRTMTRALRVQFRPSDHGGGIWRLDGMKLLNRRFKNLRASARIRVNSGTVSPDGVWDAQRREPIAPDRPAVLVMDWKEQQPLCGLAFQEIEGASAVIDVWQGRPTGDVPLTGTACDGKSRTAPWRTVARYSQDRRCAEYVKCNKFAKYLDGYVDFRETVHTSAVRIRITEPWLDNGPDGDLCRRHDGRSEHGIHFRESYCMKLDLLACGIH